MSVTIEEQIKAVKVFRNRLRSRLQSMNDKLRPGDPISGYHYSTIRQIGAMEAAIGTLEEAKTWSGLHYGGEI